MKVVVRVKAEVVVRVRAVVRVKAEVVFMMKVKLEVGR